MSDITLDRPTDTAPDATDSPGSADSPGDGVPTGIACVLVGVAGIMAAYGEFFADAAVICTVLAGLGWWATRNPSRRLRAGIAALLTVFVGVNLTYAVEDLAHPESPAGFVPTVAVVGFGAVTVGLAARAAAGRRGVGRRVLAVTGAAFLVAAGASVVAAMATTDSERLPGDVEIVARDLAFPAEVTVDTDSSGLFVRNQDRVRHTLVIEGETDAVELPAWTDVRLPVDLEPGTYRYFCDVTGHESMEGVLVVG